MAEQSRPLKEICKHQPGKYLARSSYENGPYKVYGSNSEMGYHCEPLYPGPIIVLARIGANAGALRYSTEPAWINNNASALIPDPAVDPRWLYYKLLTMSLEQYRAGTKSKDYFVADTASTIRKMSNIEKGHPCPRPLAQEPPRSGDERTTAPRRASQSWPRATPPGAGGPVRACAGRPGKPAA